MEQAITALKAALEQPYAEQARRVEQETHGRMRIDPVTGDVSIGTPTEQPEQEPVVWGVDWGSHGDRSCCTIIKQHTDGTREVVAVEYAPSYTHPPRREWRGLTEEEIHDCFQQRHRDKAVERRMITRAIEAALKEKNHE
jgi:hypothetical protein